MKTTTMLLGAAGLLAATAPALALDLSPDAAFAQVGFGTRGIHMAGVGLAWDWDFTRMRRKAELSAHTEVMINRWRYPDGLGRGREQLTQYVLLPTLRMRLDQGRSPWFLEVGIGATWLDRNPETSHGRFSTRWNFYDVVGVGHTYGGPRGQHEIGLRWNHVSNAGIRNPNPGQNFLQLRFAHRF
jgi:lipid A 3-O-deacylase